MKLSEQENNELFQILKDYMYDENVLHMKHFCQHGAVSTYDHVMNVTRTCFYLNRRWNWKCDEKNLVTGAFLHDFYLYDWHSKDNNEHRFHGFRHPLFAMHNAKKYFNVNHRVQHIIRTHMWPLTPLAIPLTKEAFLVGLVDKYCSLHETFLQRRCRHAI